MSGLTDVKLRNIRPNRNKRITLADSDGLYVEVMPSGSISWRYRMQHKGKKYKVTLGEYPVVGLSEARQLRDAAHASIIKTGVARAKTPTFQEVALKFIKRKEERSQADERNKYKQRERLERHVFPFIGQLTLDDITSSHINALVSKISDLGESETARRCLNLIKGVFDYAVNMELTSNDPSYRLKAVDLIAPKVVKHMASVRDPQSIGELMRNIAKYKSPVTKYAMELDALTFLRSFELRFLQWSDVDFDGAMLRVPAERTKMKTSDHLVPLAKQAIRILKELQVITGKQKYIFVASGDRPISENTIVQALLRMKDENKKAFFKRGEITAHGFRSMASTRLHEEGWPHPVIEVQLGHMPRDRVSAAYNYAEYIDIRKNMMQWWADYLDCLKNRK